MTTIYKYTNQQNGKVYVGKTNHLRYRRCRHLYDSVNGAETAFARALRKYGMENFYFEVLCEVPDLGDFIEMIFISALQSNDPKFGYNLTAGGEGLLGFHHTLKTKKKISSIQVGKKLSTETKRRMSLAHRGQRYALGCKRSEEYREKIRRSRLGKRLSPETIRKRQIARYGPDYTPKGWEGVWAKYQRRNDAKADGGN